MFLIAGLAAAGGAVLVATGLITTPRGALLATGAAIALGWTLTTLALSTGLVIGVAPTLWSSAVVWVAVVLVAIVTVRRSPRGAPWPPRRSEGRPAGRAIAVTSAVVLVAYLGALLVRAWQPTGVLHVDVWNQWLPKAQILYFFGGLDTGEGGFTSQMNPDYPPLHATSEALMFHALGNADPLGLARLHWVVAASFVLAVAWILAPRVRPAILWPSLLFLALSPRFGSLVCSSLAEEPLALFVGLAGLTGLVWLQDDDDRFALLCGLCLAAATATKNEGLLLSLAIVAALAVGGWSRRRLRVPALLLGGVLSVAAVWRVWVWTHDVPRNPFYDFGDFLQPGFLLGRTDRLGYALGQLLQEVATPSRWLLVVPAVLVLSALAARRAPHVAVYVVGVIALDVLGFAAIYWVSRVDLHEYVDNTVDRLPAFVAVFCGCVLPVLLDVTAPMSGNGAQGEDAAGD